jgi:CRISPR system Cascade subunit CasC
VRTIATCSPGAKLGSTAPHGRADLVLLEVGDLQPRSLANAFLEALPARGNMLQSGANRLAGQLNRLDQMYGPTAKVRALATTLDPSAFSPLPTQSLDAAIGISLDALWK